jgi:hypothetical protein
MASVGSALLCSLLASFSADVSCKSILWLLPEPRDLSDRKLNALDFLVGLCVGCCCAEDVCCGEACWTWCGGAGGGWVFAVAILRAGGITTLSRVLATRGKRRSGFAMELNSADPCRGN